VAKTPPPDTAGRGEEPLCARSCSPGTSSVRLIGRVGVLVEHGRCARHTDTDRLRRREDALQHAVARRPHPCSRCREARCALRACALRLNSGAKESCARGVRAPSTPRIALKARRFLSKAGELGAVCVRALPRDERTTTSSRGRVRSSPRLPRDGEARTGSDVLGRDLGEGRAVLR